MSKPRLLTSELLEALTARMRGASSAEIDEVVVTLGKMIPLGREDRRVRRVEYYLALTIGRLAIATSDPEAIAEVVTDHGPDIEAGLDGFRERFPRGDRDHVVEIRRWFLWLRGVAAAVGLDSR